MHECNPHMRTTQPHTHRHTYTHTHMHTGTHRHTDRQTDTHTHIDAHTHAHTEFWHVIRTWLSQHTRCSCQLLICRLPSRPQAFARVLFWSLEYQWRGSFCLCGLYCKHKWNILHKDFRNPEAHKSRMKARNKLWQGPWLHPHTSMI